jgi:hypothetical protein
VVTGLIFYEGYSESNLWQAVNKTSNKKKLLFTKNTYILKLLLNIVTARIEALVGIRFCMQLYVLIPYTIELL